MRRSLARPAVLRYHGGANRENPTNAAVGMDRIAKVAMDFGLGQKTGVGVNPEAAGRIPTHAWTTLHHKGQFRVGYTLNLAIGQGAASVSVVQLALAYAALANGGTLYQPQLVRAVETSNGTVVQEFSPRVRRQIEIRPENAAAPVLLNVSRAEVQAAPEYKPSLQPAEVVAPAAPGSGTSDAGR